MPPQRPDLILATDVPNVELDVLVGDGLDVEADGGNGGDVLAQLELVEDGGFAGSVEAQHEQAHLLGAEDAAHHLGELASHDGGCVGVCSLGVEVEVRGRSRGRSQASERRDEGGV